MTINCKGDLIDLNYPKIMGIINLTSNYFYNFSKSLNSFKLLKYVEFMLNQGADFIDIRTYSSFLNKKNISIEEEINFLYKPLSIIKKNFPKALISVDTFHAKVVEFVIENGVHIINDISGGNFEIWKIILKYQIPYILTYSKKIFYNNIEYENIILNINRFFSEKIYKLNSIGINDIILDPGINFKKSFIENFRILKYLPLISFGEYPLIIEFSKKSIFLKLLNISSNKNLNTVSIGHIIALIQGVKLLRVYDIKKAKECIKIFMNYQSI